MQRDTVSTWSLGLLAVSVAALFTVLLIVLLSDRESGGAGRESLSSADTAAEASPYQTSTTSPADAPLNGSARERAAETDSREAVVDAIVEALTNPEPDRVSSAEAIGGDPGVPVVQDEEPVFDPGPQPDVSTGSLVSEVGVVPAGIPPPSDSMQPEVDPTVRDGYDFPDLHRTRFDDCGTMRVPVDEMAQYQFLQVLSEEPLVQCLGEAVGEGCRSTQGFIDSVEYGGGLLVVRDNDDRCALGFQETAAKTVLLCDLEHIVNSTGFDQEWDMWEATFAADPGGVMSEVLIGSLQELAAQTPLVDALCQVYAL